MSDLGSVREWAGVADAYEGNAKDTNIVRFFLKETPDKKRTETEGRPCFKMVPFVEIFAPGQIRNTRICTPASDEHKKRYPIQWAKFEASDNQEAVDGTPIGEWPYLDRAQVSELKALGFLTVESVAVASDSAVAKLGMAGRDLKRRAELFLKPQGEVETSLRAELADLAKQVKQLVMERDHWKQAAEAKPRGRPKKVNDDSENDLPERA